MTTPETDSRPFSGHQLVYDYFRAREARREAELAHRAALDAVTPARDKAFRLLMEERAIERRLAEAFGSSDFQSIVCDYHYPKQTLVCVGGRITILSLGYARDLADPDVSADHHAPVAAHAVADAMYDDMTSDLVEALHQSELSD